ncbi:MAG: ATP phosphoribosyltransferase regulatory subunit, partial [Erythrobacter sp.]|nr:ATP phosphoribosyltransferase regulatory subunit [Erythrobacter sp.]
DYFGAVKGDLSEESQERLEKNPLRILDSKDARDKPFLADAPKIDAFLSDEAQAFFAAVTSGLDAAGVKWVRAESLVRGLDYYRHTAFEFIPDEGSASAAALGSQSTVLGGGRYDGLMESLGGAPTPAVGWAAGIERLAMLVGAKSPEKPLFAVVAENDEVELTAVNIATRLRKSQYSCEVIATGGYKSRYKRAVASEPHYVLVLNSGMVEEDEGFSFRLKQAEFLEPIHRDFAVAAVEEALRGWTRYHEVELDKEIDVYFENPFKP